MSWIFTLLWVDQKIIEKWLALDVGHWHIAKLNK
jgi:hypothetical protein